MHVIPMIKVGSYVLHHFLIQTLEINFKFTCKSSLKDCTQAYVYGMYTPILHNAEPR